MRKWSSLLVAVLLVCVLTGCASLFSLVFQILSVGALVAKITNLFDHGHTNISYNMYFDGYDTGVHPTDTGNLSLSGLPTGRHVLTLATADGHDGFHVNVTIQANTPVDLGSVTLINAGAISGRVMRQSGASQVPLAGVRVAAIYGGASVIRANSGATVTIPPPDDTVVIMGFTDDNGDYVLGPAAREQGWIVTCAYPGHYTDAVLASVAGGADAPGTNLLLKPDTTDAESATVQGTVSASGGGALTSALVAANLDVPFAPNMDPTRRTALQLGVGSPLLADPWFRWVSLATQTSASGAYTLVVPPGTHSIYGFKYGYPAQAVTLTLGAGEAQSADFAL